MNRPKDPIGRRKLDRFNGRAWITPTRPRTLSRRLIEGRRRRGQPCRHGPPSSSTCEAATGSRTCPTTRVRPGGFTRRCMAADQKDRLPLIMGDGQMTDGSSDG